MFTKIPLGDLDADFRFADAHDFHLSNVWETGQIVECLVGQFTQRPLVAITMDGQSKNSSLLCGDSTIGFSASSGKVLMESTRTFISSAKTLASLPRATCTETTPRFSWQTNSFP